ncbi:DUF4132 domain-containing protein [Streptomyces sp. NBC_01304]|uniref:DUF4132 domain-containing protein n=1 Tax=Streptomyces sp. NBC_01304 TaxID=2903818 RepID=UPI002E126096|nr:DUF4132 domain-containing protein [Streptomyces sp. NBC_01304]
MGDQIDDLLDPDNAWALRMRDRVAGLAPDLRELVAHLGACGTFWDWHHKTDVAWKRRTKALLKAEGARELVAAGVWELAQGGSLHDRTDPRVTYQELLDAGKKTPTRDLAFGFALAAGYLGGPGADKAQLDALITDLVTVARKNAFVLDGYYKSDPELAAAIFTALGDLSAMDALWTLHREVQPGLHSQRLLVKLVKKTANRLGVPPHQFEERTVPTGGLPADGILRLSWVGGGAVWVNLPFEAVIQLHDDYSITMDWVDVYDDERPVTRTRSPFRSPTGFKAKYYEHNVDGARRLARTLETLVQDERRRLLRLSVQNPVWPYAEWDRFYRDHPLTGRMTRALAWEYEAPDGQWAVSVPGEAGLMQLDGSAAEVSATARIRLWRAEPAGSDDAELIRKHFTARGLRQPYGQLPVPTA